MESNEQNRDVFERLRNGEAISPQDSDAHQLREASFATRKLLIQMNNASEPSEVRALLSEITGAAIEETVAVW